MFALANGPDEAQHLFKTYMSSDAKKAYVVAAVARQLEKFSGMAATDLAWDFVTELRASNDGDADPAPAAAATSAPDAATHRAFQALALHAFNTRGHTVGSAFPMTLVPD